MYQCAVVVVCRRESGVLDTVHKLLRSLPRDDVDWLYSDDGGCSRRP